jgi:hypothetical protein
MYCSIDIETTGLDSEKDQVLEFAAVLALEKKPKLSDYPFFHAKIRWDRLEGAPFALMLNSKLIAEMARLPKTATLGWIRIHELGPQFKEWLVGYIGSEGRVHPCGKNFQGFDRQFLWKLNGFPKHLFTHRALDPGAQYATWDGIPGLDSFATPSELEGKEHEALFDARKALYWALEALDKRLL